MLGRPAMGYLLVISNDDDECELCVYPQLTDVPAAGRPNSIHDLECVTKRRVQRTPSAREVDAKETRCTLRLDLREQKQ